MRTKFSVSNQLRFVFVLLFYTYYILMYLDSGYSMNVCFHFGITSADAFVIHSHHFTAILSMYWKHTCPKNFKNKYKKYSYQTTILHWFQEEKLRHLACISFDKKIEKTYCLNFIHIYFRICLDFFFYQ